MKLFFNMLEKIVTENNLFETPGNILNLDKSGIQIKKQTRIYNKKGVKKFMF